MHKLPHSSLTDTAITFMQMAVDAVKESTHPRNKVAACLGGRTKKGDLVHAINVNHWPQRIVDSLGTDARIGLSSGTVHAETAAIFNLSAAGHGTLSDLSICVTDLPCPNCVKNLAEAGAEYLFIDHKGFEKDFAQRRGDHVRDMSLDICRHAGISVFKVFRKEQRLEPLVEIPDDYTPPLERPVEHILLDEGKHNIEANTGQGTLSALMAQKSALPPIFAAIQAHDAQGRGLLLIAEPHPAVGYTSDDLKRHGGKYSHIQQPVNRLLMHPLRHGLMLKPETLYSSRIPTSREMVNMIACGIDRIAIGDLDESRDADGVVALKLLKDHQILTID